MCLKQGYDSNFFYGGDGYFDNMNAYFGETDLQFMIVVAEVTQATK
jgi:phosphoglycerol transferase MdoB-like AlkP superfamily enzyme